MKITTQRKCWLGILLLLVIVAGACKKDKPVVVAPSELQGYWTENKTYEQSLILSKSIHFFRDSVHFMYSDQAILQHTYIKGKFRIQGNSLIKNFKEIMIGRGNKVISTDPVSGIYLENARFTLKDYILTINYIDYPAGVATPTTVVFYPFPAN